ncbi:glycerophosphoryl diester phosphodiesterase [Actinacidiphila alni]|uniref:Glycerophosphoryl diester phosphodiesterase n=1 Tax=Actinacidiphila alni TaxID=380248 RepID=A0A1I2K205_9ACTN|nr:glycerophosphodiester phosphodiesterase [Actinacidiphila alni]SFF61205.1 glycerophosphoryl diester phosphodiesterase [Actinacidiphila alni]
MTAPIAVAHRGDPYVVRENTLPSVRSALVKGAGAVEVDVKMTADGVPVLLHDDTLERLWKVPEAVGDLTSKDVTDLTDGGVPTLADAFAELRRHPTGGRMMLDLTGVDQVEPTLAAVVEADVADRVYYCGGLGAMRTLRERDADAEIAMTWKTVARPPQSLLDELRPRWINLRFGLVDESTVRWAAAHGLLVGAWTADWRRNMVRLLDLGVDAVTTNRLDTFQRLLVKRAASVRA